MAQGLKDGGIKRIACRFCDLQAVIIPFNPSDLWEICPKWPKMVQKMIFMWKYLHISKKSSTFVADFD